MQLLKKFLILFLVFSLSLSPLVALAYFNDQETFFKNSFACSTLDFALDAPNDFTPAINSPSSQAVKNIGIVNLGTTNFFYQIETSNASGTLCDYLNIEANLNGFLEYSGSLIGFFVNKTEFQSPQNWQFSATLSTTSPSIKNTFCNFDFIFNGYQATSSLGFSDQEIINNTITAGNFDTPPPLPPVIQEKCIKINEVYYDPDTTHGSSNDEWIEIYNACQNAVNLKDWVLMDNSSSTEIINSNPTIDPGQFLVVSSNASTWSYWPLVPSNAVKIALGGTQLFNGLNNDNDRVFLYDNLGNEIDQVSWGNDISAFDPAVLDVDKGHSIARKTKGVDTDVANDWEDLSTPNPGTNPHSFFATTNHIIEQITQLFESSEQTESPTSTPEIQDTQPPEEEPMANNENTNLNDVFLSPENSLPQEQPQENIETEPNSVPEAEPTAEPEPQPPIESASE